MVLRVGKNRPGEKSKVGLIEKAVRLAPTRRRGGSPQTFVRTFFSSASKTDLTQYSAQDMCGLAQAILGFAGTRKTGTAKIRVYNPAKGSDGWASSHSVIELVNDDMPFLVDSVTSLLNRRKDQIFALFHPVLDIRRDGKGHLKGLDGRKGGLGRSIRESFIHIEIGELSEAEIKILRGELADVLRDVRNAVKDWRPMLDRMNEVITGLETSPPRLSRGELAEGKAFLEWMRDNHFTFLGVRSYALVTKGGKSYLKPDHAKNLGILRVIEKDAAARHNAPLSPAFARHVKKKELLIVTKAYSRSRVHRCVHMDYIGVRQFDKKGNVIGEHRFLGLFTSLAYNQSPRYIPLLRRKITNVLANSGLAHEGHDNKGLQNILETFPRDELFQISERDLKEIGLGILSLEERRRTALFVRRDYQEKFVSCLVFVPRDRYDSDLVETIQDILEDAFKGTVNTFGTQVGDAPLARLYFVIKNETGNIANPDPDLIESLLVEVSRTWDDRLKEALIAAKGEKAALALMNRYADAFSAAYQEDYREDSCVPDIALLEEVLNQGALGLEIYRPTGVAAKNVRLKFYHAGNAIAPSDVLPMLENMGLRVLRDIPYRVHPRSGKEDRRQLPAKLWIHEFVMVTADGKGFDISGVKENFKEAITKAWFALMENDGLNRLVIGAGLGWREVVVIRAYCKYLIQANVPFSQDYMQAALLNNPGLTRALVDLFHARFNPAFDSRAPDLEKGLLNVIEAGLEDVANLDEDRILRRFLNLIESTLRTNFYQRDSGQKEKSILSFKIDSQSVEELPLPRPHVEIFVYSPRMEGVHLRGGKVARGGLRWSDRREDFRTEILGLMKAQQVKNTVIVPVGSKGGFVVKNPPPASAGRQAFLDEGIECYKSLIRGMLDLTDNFKGGRLVHPSQVIRHDGDDPYLVVAADKGTATFSDIANGVSAEYGFWLDDAFASGGSAGYDHKKMGITARGGWESVKRHFRELGLDTQREDFTVIGIGDMSGDVFGNGMLLSRHIRLIGAFNHMHIFLDPDPDPQSSFAERRRLFRLSRSTWADYNRALISKGGGIFERSAKSIDLSREIKAALGVTRDKMTPNELIREMLRASVDLLWFGGIGTYVKAQKETHLEAGDRANDAVRINGLEVGARVVGEGANLGVTQLGRIEYAAGGNGDGGGCINTDAIDNSAGVDCSDHEVNIKIALGDIAAKTNMNRKKRDALLVKMTKEVAALVLKDNYRQTQAITLAQVRTAESLDAYARLIQDLERQGHLDRQLEFLPDDEVLGERASAGGGFARPEIAVILAYAKLWLYDEILASDIPDAPLFSSTLLNNFPLDLQARYRETLLAHRLRREIIATKVTNNLVNRAGITFINDMMDKSGLSAADAARAFSVTNDIFSLRPLWEAVEALDNKVPAAVQAEMLLSIRRLIDRSSLWFLRHVAPPLDISATCVEFSPGINALKECFEEILEPATLALLKERQAELTAHAVPPALARDVATLDLLASGLDVVRLSAAMKVPVDLAGRVYVLVGASFHLDWLRAAVHGLAPESRWDREASHALVDDLYRHQGELTRQVIKSVRGRKSRRNGEKWVLDWCEKHSHVCQRLEKTVCELKSAATVDFAMLAVACRQVSQLKEG